MSDAATGPSKNMSVPANGSVAKTHEAPPDFGDLGRICEMCRNYELQLQMVQVSEDSLRNQLADSQEIMKSLKDELRKEQASRIELEETFNDEARAAEGKLKELSSNLESSNDQILQIKELFYNLEKDVKEKLAQINQAKEELRHEVSRLSRENDALLGRNMAKSRELQSEIINLPQDLNEIHFYLLKLKEDFITTLVAKERNEETYKSERLFIQDQSRNDIQNRDKLIEKLSQDNECLQSELGHLRISHEKLEQKLQDQEEILGQCQEKIAKLVVENDSLSTDLKWKVGDLSSSKEKLEEENKALRNKVSGLQLDLDNSEAVQKDFVKLSQSLQIQLEKIRQADSEVRWQHEDDFNECNNCKKKLNSRRDKSHCNHCGRVLCSDCNCKTIHCGPKGRPYKVCNVCHTLLDHETAPFFSNQLPTGS